MFSKRLHYKFYNNRHANASFVKKWCIKSRLWNSIESSVGILRIRKCDNMRYFHRKKVCTHHVSQGRPLLNSNLFGSEKLEQIFFHEFFAWTRLNKPLASHKTIYEHKDLDIWFSTNRTFDPSWRFFTFGQLRGLRRPLNCPQILITSLEHLKRI